MQSNRYLVTSFDKDINTAIEANAMVHKKVGSLLKDKFPHPFSKIIFFSYFCIEKISSIFLI